jgi:hypothetical protein
MEGNEETLQAPSKDKEYDVRTRVEEHRSGKPDAAYPYTARIPGYPWVVAAVEDPWVEAVVYLSEAQVYLTVILVYLTAVLA